MKKNLFTINIPEGLIAHKPVSPRDYSRLIISKKGQKAFKHSYFYCLKDFIEPGSLIVFNQTKVDPCRYLCQRKSGGKVEVFVLDWNRNPCKVMLKGGKKLKEGESLINSETGNEIFKVKKAPKEGFSVFEYLNSEEMLGRNKAKVPLPPYIDANKETQDFHRKNYQSIFAKYSGSVAAPTASLHFSDKVLDGLKEKGIDFCYLTLHVGLGTFKPMSHENVSNHKMHSEFYDLSSQTAEKINKAKEEGRKIIAVGTTALRVLEFCSNKEGEVLPGKGFCDLFILPGFPFRVANGLITNFHQSGSTLLCLVSAFLGLSQIKTLYKEAIDQKYRFHSYGDCCLFFR